MLLLSKAFNRASGTPNRVPDNLIRVPGNPIRAASNAALLGSGTFN